MAGSQAGYTIVLDVSEGGTDTAYSKPFSLKKGSLFSMHIVTSGSTPTGTFTLWQSNKQDPSLDDDTDWVENSDVSFTDPSGSSQKQFINAGNAAARWYRLKYVSSSGTTTNTAYVFAGKGA